MSGALVDIKQGSIYVPSQVAETYFHGIDAVIILIRDGELLVMPVHQSAAGGVLLKRKNSAGDRVACAPDVFQANDLINWEAKDLKAHWSRDLSALIVPLSPKTAN